MDVFTESSEGRGGQISLCHCYSLSLSEVSEGAGSPARAWRPLSSLFSITGLFSYKILLKTRVSSWNNKNIIYVTFPFVRGILPPRRFEIP